MAPSAEYLPVAQSTQTVTPAVAAYFPALQFLQEVAPVAASAYLPAVQSEHTPAPVAPVVVEYLPVAQSPAQMAAEVAPVAAE